MILDDKDQVFFLLFYRKSAFGEITDRRIVDNHSQWFDSVEGLCCAIMGLQHKRGSVCAPANGSQETLCASLETIRHLVYLLLLFRAAGQEDVHF